MRIYISGPLFTTPERHFNCRLTKCLRDAGHQVWLPQEKKVKHNVKSLFHSNMEGIEWAELVLANMDGPDPDSGTCFECGVAWERGKPFIGFRTDTRLADEPGLGSFNLMLEVSATAALQVPSMSIESTIARLVKAVNDLQETLK